MPAATDPTNFQREPLRYFDERLPAGEETFRISPSLLCVAEPAAAKRVLANPDGLFEEHSDFFHTRRGPFGPREVQLALGRGARQLLTAHAAARAEALPALVERELAPTSEWPDAGNQLLYRHFADVLVAPERAAALRPTVEAVVRRAVLAGARERQSRLRRWVFRRKVFRELTREVELRIAEPAPAEAPRDLFDVLARAGIDHEGVRSDDLGELYLPFLFAVAGSVGFALGWALYLLGTHPPEASEGAEPDWIAREALRLWPVAWQFHRRPAKAHEIAGVPVTPEDGVLVSPYLTHRHPDHWEDAQAFRPARWAGRQDDRPFFPFGWGPHTCAAAALSLELVRDALAVLSDRYEISVSTHSNEPFTGPSLAPPRFRLELAPKAAGGVTTKNERR